jgi:hypothetical protein
MTQQTDIPYADGLEKTTNDQGRQLARMTDLAVGIRNETN